MMLRLLLALILFAVPARADEASLVAALNSGGHVLMIRHALAPGTGDPVNFDVEDCSTQRNLDEHGRAQARRIGDWLRARGVTPGIVYSSPWCRCRETAELMALAPVETHPGLASFFRRREREAQTMAALSALLDGLRDSEAPVVLVTHQVNITAATGIFPSSGEGVVARIGAGGTLEPLGRLDFEN